VLLAPETAAFCKSRLTTCGGAENCRAAFARHGRLGVREDRGDGVAAWAFDVHEEAVRVLHQPLLLVGAPLLLGARME